MADTREWEDCVKYKSLSKAAKGAISAKKLGKYNVL